jgi:hypothetical protein
MNKLKNLLIEATIEITDIGVTWESKIEVVSKVNDRDVILYNIKKFIKKYKHASDLSNKYTYVVKEYKVVGNCI